MNNKHFNLKDMKIFFVDYNQQITELLEVVFKKYRNVHIVNSDIESFCKNNESKIECLVSPANSYGIMTGGFDEGLSNYLGRDFQLKVQQFIKENYRGEQPVGSSFIIDTDIKNIKLIHTPTMQTPTIIKDDFLVYTCTRSTLLCAINNNIKVLVMPAFGTETGGVCAKVAVKRMLDAYNQLLKYDK